MKSKSSLHMEAMLIIFSDLAFHDVTAKSDICYW